MSRTDEQWIKNRIGLYLRFEACKLPSAKTEQAWVEKTAKLAKQLHAQLANVPPGVGTATHGLFHSDWATQLRADLMSLEGLPRARRPRGAPEMTQRDSLLADVATYLATRGMRAGKAAEAAKAALDAAGIKTREDPAKTAATVRRVRPVKTNK